MLFYFIFFKGFTCVVVCFPGIFLYILRPGQREEEQQDAQHVFTGDLPHGAGGKPVKDKTGQYLAPIIASHGGSRGVDAEGSETHERLAPHPAASDWRRACERAPVQPPGRTAPPPDVTRRDVTLLGFHGNGVWFWRRWGCRVKNKPDTLLL